MGDEEKNRKKREEQKKEAGSEPPTKLPGPFGRLLRTPAGHTQMYYIVAGSLEEERQENMEK